MHKTLLISIAAATVLSACTDSNQKHRDAAIEYHGKAVSNKPSHGFHRENIDAKAPWQTKEVRVPGVNDRRQPLPSDAHVHTRPERNDIDTKAPWEIKRRETPGVNDRPKPLPLTK